MRSLIHKTNKLLIIFKDFNFKIIILLYFIKLIVIFNKEIHLIYV